MTELDCLLHSGVWVGFGLGLFAGLLSATLILLMTRAPGEKG